MRAPRTYKRWVEFDTEWGTFEFLFQWSRDLDGSGYEFIGAKLNGNNYEPTQLVLDRAFDAAWALHNEEYTS